MTLATTAQSSSCIAYSELNYSTEGDVWTLNDGQKIPVSTGYKFGQAVVGSVEVAEEQNCVFTVREGRTNAVKFQTTESQPFAKQDFRRESSVIYTCHCLESSFSRNPRIPPPRRDLTSE